MQVVRFMYLKLKDVPEEDQEEAMEYFNLCYDKDVTTRLSLLKHTRNEDTRIIYFFKIVFLRSESPSQIFMQVVHLMYLELKYVSREDLEEAMENYLLCYDNMC